MGGAGRAATEEQEGLVVLNLRPYSLTLIILNIFDAISTAFLIQETNSLDGELNPIAHYLMSTLGVNAVILFKIIFVTLFLIYPIWTNFKTDNKLIIYTIYTVLFMYIFVTILHLRNFACYFNLI